MPEQKIKWFPDVRPKDYDAAYNYLSLLLDAYRATRVVTGLRMTHIQWRRANDLLRASHRNPASTSDPGVAKDLKKIRHGVTLGPVLVVSFDFGADIADGYHRVSAVYSQDPFALIPCRIASAVPSRP